MSKTGEELMKDAFNHDDTSGGWISVEEETLRKHLRSAAKKGLDRGEDLDRTTHLPYIEGHLGLLGTEFMHVDRRLLEGLGGKTITVKIGYRNHSFVIHDKEERMKVYAE